MASPGHALGHCKVKCTLCSGQQVWWSLHWGLRQCCAGSLRGFFRFCPILESFSDAGCARQPLHTEPRQCVGGQPWACPGPLQGQMQPVQWSAGLVEPALGAAALLCRWFAWLPVLSHSGVLQQWRLCSAQQICILLKSVIRILVFSEFFERPSFFWSQRKQRSNGFQLFKIQIV